MRLHAITGPFFFFFFLMLRRPPIPPLFPYPTLSQSHDRQCRRLKIRLRGWLLRQPGAADARSEEHTSELQSRGLISYAAFCLEKNNRHHPATLQRIPESPGRLGRARGYP